MVKKTSNQKEDKSSGNTSKFATSIQRYITTKITKPKSPIWGTDGGALEIDLTFGNIYTKWLFSEYPEIVVPLHDTVVISFRIRYLQRSSIA